MLVTSAVLEAALPDVVADPLPDVAMPPAPAPFPLPSLPPVPSEAYWRKREEVIVTLGPANPTFEPDTVVFIRGAEQILAM